MLKNSRQLSSAQQQLQLLETARRNVSREDYPGALFDAHCGMLDNDINQLRAKINAYLECQSGNAELLAFDFIDHLGEELVKARISRHMTQEELAQKLNKKPQQIQRYESTNYKTASLDTIQKVKNAVTG